MNVKVTWGVCILYDVHENDVRPVRRYVPDPLFFLPSPSIIHSLSLSRLVGGAVGSDTVLPILLALPSPRLNIETFHIPSPSLSSLMQTGHTDRPKFGRLSLEIESATVLVISYIYS